MNTSCDISSTPLPATNAQPARGFFARLQQLVATPRFVSVDLVDNILRAMPPDRDTRVPPHTTAPERPRMVPLRFD